MLPTMDLVYLLAAFFAPAAGAAVLALAWRWERRAHHEVRALLHDERHARSAAELRLARVADFDQAERATRGAILRWMRVNERRLHHMEAVLADIHEIYPTEDVEVRQLEVGALLLRVQQIRTEYEDDDPEPDNGHAG